MVRWHCFFEQSGTFRDEFRKLGYQSWDYDIENQFSKTDFQVDLFDEIRRGFDGLPSIFDNFDDDDRIIAFFPCVRFSVQSRLIFRCKTPQLKTLSVVDKCLASIREHTALHDLYVLLNKLVVVCSRLNLPLVIENPYRANEHYLTCYWFPNPSLIDRDRRANGDYFNKVTQYFFFGCEAKENLLFDEPIAFYPKRTVCELQGIERSLISGDYARRFIRSHLVGI